MRNNFTILLCALMVAVCVGLSGSVFAANVFFNVANGDWNVAGNWTPVGIPSQVTQDVALIDTRICNVTTPVACPAGTTRVYVRYAGAQLNISANMSNVGSWSVESNATTLPAPTINQTAGTVNAVWDGTIGRTNNFPSVFNLSGGTFNLGSGNPAYLLQVLGNGGRFNISGTGRAELNSGLKVGSGAQVTMTGGFLDTDYNGGGGTGNMLTIDLGGTVTISGGTANLKSRSLVNGTLEVAGTGSTITMGDATNGCVTNASTGTFKFTLAQRA